MKPRIKIAAAQTPDGGELELFQHDGNFSININGQELMNSLHHESEVELARLGCSHLAGRKSVSILIGGLGMGYTLHQVLDMVGPDAHVAVGELLVPVIEWNKTCLGQLTDHPLKDDRVNVHTGDVVSLILRSKNKFDGILLDIDNGPSAMTDSGNRRLYGKEGIEACKQALRNQGVLAVWSAEPDKQFEKRLITCGFFVTRFRVPAYKGSKTLSRFIFVASEDKNSLPPGGGVLREQTRSKKEAKKGRTKFRKRR